MFSHSSNIRISDLHESIVYVLKLFVISLLSRSPICHCIYPLLGMVYPMLLLLKVELNFMYILTLFIFFKNYFVWWLKCIFLYILIKKGSQRVLYHIKIITKSFFLDMKQVFQYFVLT